MNDQDEIDAEIIEYIYLGEYDRATTLIIKHYKNHLLNSRPCQVLTNKSDREEVVHTMAMRAPLKFKRQLHESNFLAFLVGVLRFCAKEKRRELNPKTAALVEPTEQDIAKALPFLPVSVLDDMIRDQDALKKRNALKKALKKLAPGCERIIRARHPDYLEKPLSYQELKVKIGYKKSLGSLKFRYFWCKSKLQWELIKLKIM